MRIWFFSDCHLNRSVPWTPPATPDCDVIVIAGDVTENLRDRVLPWLRDQVVPRNVPTIYVPGNHDFWGRNLNYEIGKCRPIADELGIHLLAEGESVIIDGTRFIGATLWADLECSPGGAFACGMSFASHNDHKYIKVGPTYRRLLPKDFQEAHFRQLAAIERILAEDFDGATVVVTHHAPHPTSLKDGHPKDAVDGMYASDLTELIERHRPELWLHGHIHCNRDYFVGETRVVCNPRGHVYDERFGPRTWRVVENREFMEDLVLEVEPRPRPLCAL